MTSAQLPIHTELYERQTALIDGNVELLRQGIALLTRLTDSAYRDPAPGLLKQRVGAQLRHVIEFYESFLDGVESSHIDYDQRKRDERIEKSREFAIENMSAIISRLENTRQLRGDFVLWVNIEDAPAGGGENFLTSSVGRELQVLRSHTIHHYALIAFALAAHGVETDANFGVAPSTLRYRSRAARIGEAA
jgi:hypothetical protein